MSHVPYKGNSGAWPDVISGRVDLIMEPYGSAAPMIKEGRLMPLGVTSAKRLASLPAIASIADQGAPGYSFYLWLGFYAPAHTPKDVVQKLSTALRAALAMPEVQKHLREEGDEPMSMSPEEFNHFLQVETGAMAKLVSDIGLPKQ
jgi:tripartite-type tricarboxylate transporter receptor subunit TctC